MNRDDLYLDSIFEACQMLLSFVESVDADEFQANKMLNSAVIRQLEIIGEASGQLSKDFRNAHAEIPWGEMIGMRNKLIHDYMNVDLELAWETVQQDIPRLAIQLQKLLK